MIRTRDLLIFVAVLFFLGIGIAVTLLLEHTAPFLEEDGFSLDQTQTASTSYTAKTHSASIDRNSVIARLREALALNPSEVEPNPSVEEVPQEETKEADSESAASSIQSCGGSDDALSYSQSWPLTGVSFAVVGGVRSVVHAAPSSSQNVDVNASTSASSSLPSTKTLISFPVAPSYGALEYCVPSEVVGITTSGSLMFNTDASFYRGYGKEYLIGYARDGFPIYGYYEGAVDSCGGYMHPSGYRYTVSPDRDHLIGCFKAPVSAFSS
jgi:hypothetical protein